MDGPSSRIRMLNVIGSAWRQSLICLCVLFSIHEASSFLSVDTNLLQSLSMTKSYNQPASSGIQLSFANKHAFRFNTSLSSSRNGKSTVTGGVTSELISQLAIIALKIRLEAQSDVQCKVNGRTRDLMMQGKVGPVTVRGKGWESPLGLTCRVIEAIVDECSLDVAKIVQNRKLNLIVPAKGNAMIALDTRDFGNFITHPLLKPPDYQSSDGKSHPIKFIKDGVSIDFEQGLVHFKGSCMGDDLDLELSRGEVFKNDKSRRSALVKVTIRNPDDKTVEEDDLKKQESEVASQLSTIVSDYFTDLVFELDGTYLSFRDMMVTDKGKSTKVMLALSILVHKFPSPGVAF